MSIRDSIEHQTISYFRALGAVHRLKFVPIGCFINSWGLFLSLRAFPLLHSFLTSTILVISILLYISSNMVNMYADYSVDLHNPVKRFNAQCVVYLGPKTVLCFALTEMGVALLMAVFVSVYQHSAVFVVLALLWAGTALLYDLEPFHFKKRGHWGTSIQAIQFAFLPGMLGVTLLYGTHIPLSVWLVVCGVVGATYSLVIWTNIRDIPADTVSSIRTTAAHYGPVGAMRITCMLLTTATCVLFLGFCLLFGWLWAFVGAGGYLLTLGWTWRVGLQCSNDQEALAFVSRSFNAKYEHFLHLLCFAGLLLPGLALNALSLITFG